MQILSVPMYCSWVITVQLPPWSESSVKGCKKFLDRVAGLTDILSEESVSDELEMKLHRTIKKVSGDIENLKFNTAIASLMTLINEITAEGHLSKDDLAIFIKLLSHLHLISVRKSGSSSVEKACWQ